MLERTIRHHFYHVHSHFNFSLFSCRAVVPSDWRNEKSQIESIKWESGDAVLFRVRQTSDQPTITQTNDDDDSKQFFVRIFSRWFFICDKCHYYFELEIHSYFDFFAFMKSIVNLLRESIFSFLSFSIHVITAGENGDANQPLAQKVNEYFFFFFSLLSSPFIRSINWVEK